jgi:Diguanylate cyclase, GGDEF domain
MTEAVADDGGPRPVERAHRLRSRLVDGAPFADHLCRAVQRNTGVPGGLAVLAVAPDPPVLAHHDDTWAIRQEIHLVTAARLVGCLHYSSLVTRAAGDQFVVLAEGIGSVVGAAALAEHILEAVRRPEMVRNERPVTASIGIAFQEPGSTADVLQHHAIGAMYSARTGGGDRYQVYGVGTDHVDLTTARVS